MEEALLTRMLAEHEIDDAIAIYCRGVDRGDEELMASAFHADADVNHGLHGRTHADDPAYSQFSMFHHQLGNRVIVLDGDRAASETYFTAVQGFTYDGVGYDQMVKARYLDRWERRGGPFRIVYRRVVWDWVRTEPSSPSWPNGSAITWNGHRVEHGDIFWGERSRGDLSYALFGDLAAPIAHAGGSSS